MTMTEQTYRLSGATVEMAGVGHLTATPERTIGGEVLRDSVPPLHGKIATIRNYNGGGLLADGTYSLTYTITRAWADGAHQTHLADYYLLTDTETGVTHGNIEADDVARYIA